MSGVKKIINDPSESVSEFIEGLLYQYPNTLQKLENHNVVLANPLVPGAKVHLLSGGGSGHEPAHAGYIGKGMLSGGILGGIFASPAVSSILAAVRSVAPAEEENGGCLLIVKNYTGDRLNFGMACEMATAEKRKCRMIVVADDCAVPRNKGVTGARGVAGRFSLLLYNPLFFQNIKVRYVQIMLTNRKFEYYNFLFVGTVFVHKICGAAAEKGMSLDEIATLGEYAASRIGSLGVALNAVTIPGASEANDRLASDKMEIGLGIHGEAGIRQCDLMSADAIAEEMLNTIQKFGYGPNENIQHVKEGDDVAILVNNLGG